jgi:hypothetical protein
LREVSDLGQRAKGRWTAWLGLNIDRASPEGIGGERTHDSGDDVAATGRPCAVEGGDVVGRPGTLEGRREEGGAARRGVERSEEAERAQVCGEAGGEERRKGRCTRQGERRR